MSDNDGSKALDVWRSMVAAKASMNRITRPTLCDHGLTAAQFGVLRVVGDAGDQGIKLSEVGGRLFVTCGNVTGLVDRLEESGLLVRDDHPDDRRAILAKLTSSGRLLYEDIVPRHRARVSRIMACLSTAEMEMLVDLLWRIKESADSYVEPAAEAASMSAPQAE